MLLVRISFCTTKSDIRQYWCFACFLLHAQMFKLTKHSFLNSIRIWSGSELWQRFFSSFFKGERIQKSQKAGHHWPASETPLNGVSLACRRWPNVECWLGSFENFRWSGPVLLRNSIFLWFFRWRGGPDPLSPIWIRAWDRTISTLIQIYRKPILLCVSALRTFYRSTSRERRVFFLNFVIFFNSESSSTCVYLCKKNWLTRCPQWVYYIINGICADGEQAKSVLVFWRKSKNVAIHR